MKHLHFCGMLLALCIGSGAYAQDRIFNYTYQSGVLKPGDREIEIWNTLRSGRDGFYRALDSRIEFEFGVARNLQASFYLNVSHAAFERNIDYGNGIHEIKIESESSWGFSSEWKYKLSDPVANALGAALYCELSVSPEEFEVEIKAIFDRQTGKFTHALNLVAENEWETEVEKGVTGSGAPTQELENEFEFGFEFDYGLSYQLNPNWHAGLELVNRNHVESGDWNTSVLYAGPGFSYVNGPVWINFTVLPQVTGLIYPDEVPDSGLLLEGYEKVESRLIFSYMF